MSVTLLLKSCKTDPNELSDKSKDASSILTVSLNVARFCDTLDTNLYPSISEETFRKPIISPATKLQFLSKITSKPVSVLLIFSTPSGAFITSYIFQEFLYSGTHIILPMSVVFTSKLIMSCGVFAIISAWSKETYPPVFTTSSSVYFTGNGA